MEDLAWPSKIESFFSENSHYRTNQGNLFFLITVTVLSVFVTHEASVLLNKWLPLMNFIFPKLSPIAYISDLRATIMFLF